MTNEEKKAYREAAIARIKDYDERVKAFMTENEAHFASLKQKKENGDYEGIKSDPQNYQESLELLERIEDNNMEGEIENYEGWRRSIDLHAQMDVFRKESREINRLIATLAIDYGKDMGDYFFAMLENALKLREENGENGEISLEMIEELEDGFAYFRDMVAVNELKLAALDEAALN